MALGAGRRTVVGMILNGAFRRVADRSRLGLPLAVGAGYLLSAQLFGVQFWDPPALAVGALSLGTCALVAAIIPARRAASISPIARFASRAEQGPVLVRPLLRTGPCSGHVRSPH